MSSEINDTSLVWFRNDLRVYDNTSLAKAAESGRVLGVYFFDPRHFENKAFGFAKTGKYRAQFLRETVIELQENLKNLGIPLLVYHTQPEEKLPELIQSHKIKKVYLQKEWTDEENSVLEAVKKATAQEVSFVETYDQFLFHPDDVPYDSFQDIPNVFTQFRKKCEKGSRVRPCIPAPEVQKPSALDIVPSRIPSLEELGYNAFTTDTRTAFPYTGGENQAKQRIQEYFWESRKLSYYKHTRNGLVGTDYSSKLSHWLANGSISARSIYWEVKNYEKKVVKNQDTYWLIFELIWRDYFKYVSLKYGNRIFQLGGILNKDYHWHRSKKALEEWITGSTSEPFVNANMRELAATGWMSNRGRQNVASYWSKELQQDWRIGAAYFESMLLDYDVHSNWGNWMYNSGVGNDPRDRKFNVRTQAERYDSAGTYRRLWLQETLF